MGTDEAPTVRNLKSLETSPGGTSTIEAVTRLLINEPSPWGFSKYALACRHFCSGWSLLLDVMPILYGAFKR